MTRQPMITIHLESAFAALIDDEMRAKDAERAVQNRTAWASARKPTRPDDVHVGDLVVLESAYWQRGPGRVDEVDAFGNVWAVYGRRENPHPTDSKTIRCYSPWSEVRIVAQA